MEPTSQPPHLLLPQAQLESAADQAMRSLRNAQRKLPSAGRPSRLLLLRNASQLENHLEEKPLRRVQSLRRSVVAAGLRKTRPPSQMFVAHNSIKYDYICRLHLLTLMTSPTSRRGSHQRRVRMQPSPLCLKQKLNLK